MRKKKKGGGIFAGFLLLVIGVILLWWNEGRTIKQSAVIGEVESSYVEVPSNTVDVSNNNKIIYTSGNLVYDEPGANDTEFDIQLNTAVIERTVEMYQWIEECTDNDDGSTDCKYTKEWSEKLIDSSNFEEQGHDNPTSMPFQSQRFYANNLKLDAFGIDYFKDVLSTSANYTDLNSQVAAKYNMIIKDNYYTTVADNSKEDVGDVRVKFSYNTAKELSAIGLQSEQDIVAYTGSNGYTAAKLEEAHVTAVALIQHMKDDNNTLKWILRLVGTLLIIFGFLGIVSPLQKLANLVPFVGRIVGTVTGLFALILGLCVSLVVIAVAWFRFRPVLSIILIVIGVGSVILVKKLKGKKDNVAEPQVEQPAVETPNVAQPEVQTPVIEPTPVETPQMPTPPVVEPQAEQPAVQVPVENIQQTDNSNNNQI